MDWVRLASNDADLHFAWNAMIHDADVNKYSVTTISQNIDVAKRYNARFQVAIGMQLASC